MVSNDAHKPDKFPVIYAEILQRIDAIDPITYGRTRNFTDGDVSYLSPYISRGVISTKLVLRSLLDKGHHVKIIEKFIQELAWRDYWQQIWIAKGDAIDSDLKHPQRDVENYGMPRVLYEGNTGIVAIDEAIAEFYNTGYLHNHVRMYIAAIACNMGKSHWKNPARWMYYHLIDADWASNALSWQWVAGSNSNKKYVANQDNINKYCRTNQKNTFLDIPYEAFNSFDIPDKLLNTDLPEIITPLPAQRKLQIAEDVPTLVYNFYNLDPEWKSDLVANRILLLAPSHFKKYPISQKSMNFMLALTKNIPNIQIFVGEFEDFANTYRPTKVFFKEHPSNKNYIGNQEPRDWMFSVTGYYPSFFAYWKKCKKELTY